MDSPMPFTFSYRSPYENLTGRFVRRFEDHSILSWFQENWHSKDESKELLGKTVYGFEALFEKISESQIPIPKTSKELGEVLKKHVYAEEGTRFSPNVLEVFTDDDELDLQYFFVEDEFAKQHPERTAFLLHDGSLPTKVSDSNSEPCTFLYVHSPVQSADSQTWDRVVCPGVRLADDPKAVIEAYEELKYAEAETFFSALVEWKENKMDWPEILKKWVEKSDDTDDESKIKDASLVLCDDHICQLHHHAETWRLRRNPKRLFYQTIIFDDVWAASHPDLAKSIDYYASDKSLLAK
jgi:hypothetical protein